MTPRRCFVFFGALAYAALVVVDCASDTQVVFVSSAVILAAIQLAFLMPSVMAIAGPSVREGALRITRYGLILAAIGGAGAAAVLQGGRVVFGVSARSNMWSAGPVTFAIYDHLGETFDRSLYQVYRLTPGILITQYIRDFDGDLSSAITFVNADCIRMYEDTFVLTPIV